MIKSLFSKEAILAFYLVSGEIKIIYPLLYISNIPDITLISAMLLVLIMIYDMQYTLKQISIKHLELIVILILFYFFIIFSLGYSSSDAYSLTKSVNFGTVVLAFLFPLLTQKFNKDFFIHSLTLFIFIISIIFLNFYISYINRDNLLVLNMSSEEVVKLTVGYLSIAILNGIIILYYFFKKNQIFWIQWSIVITAFIFLVASGGRGPLLIVLLILGVYLFYQLILSLICFKIKKLILPIVVVSTLIGGFFLLVSTNNIESNSRVFKLFKNSMERFETLQNSQGGGKSAYSRVLYMKFSIDKINQQPIWGYGIGSFGFEYNNIDEKDYPHNIFLEVWFELGIVPLLLFLLFFYTVYRHILSVKCYWCMVIYFYFFLNILKSDSLIDIRMLASFFGVFLLVKGTHKINLTTKRIKNNCYN